jgi:hypothetical protein
MKPNYKKQQPNKANWLTTEKRRRREKTETSMSKIGSRTLSSEAVRWKSISITLSRKRPSIPPKKKWISKIAWNSENKLKSKRINSTNLKMQT